MDIQAKLFVRDEGKTVRIGRMTFHFKMTAEDTQGAYTVAEAHVPPDSGSGLHRHWSFDEAALVIDGKFEFSTSMETRAQREKAFTGRVEQFINSAALGPVTAALRSFCRRVGFSKSFSRRSPALRSRLAARTPLLPSISEP